MELFLLMTQMLFALMVAIGVFLAIRLVLATARWEVRQADQQALSEVSLPTRRLLGLVMLLGPFAARFAKPSLAVKRELGVLGFHSKIDDLFFSRLRWSFILLFAFLAGGATGLAFLIDSGPLMRWAVFTSLIVVLLASVMPYIWLRDRAAAARRSVLRGFPTFLDVLALVLESGQNFQSALQLSVQKLSGASGDVVLKRQLQEISQDIRAGQPKVAALQRFSDRLGLPEVTQFTASIKAADQQGVSVTALLRRQAEQLRTSRALAAERQAMKLPVKLLLPLAVCIFPCTFLILAFPLAVRLSNSGLF
ncbi:MAG: type II secretion system F family protein [Burkholderiaceae bacterium]|nr:type II secretion system F family protein [Burkholderiaceae bacterium]